jgi:excisionase family DNA binding protein
MSAHVSSRALLSRKEFSNLTGLSLRTVAKLIASRDVRSIRVGRRRLIPRVELEKFVRRDHPTKSRTRKVSRPTKRKRVRVGSRKSAKRPQPRGSRRVGKKKTKRGVKSKRIRRTRVALPSNYFQSPEHQRALDALARMRRDNVSLAKATRLAHIKPTTFLRYVGSAVYRSGPGKPWKAANADTLKAQMRVLTPTGPVYAVVRNSRERKRLSDYEFALRQFRAGEEGADKELEKFRGLRVGGHVLVTDLDQLIQLEEAGKLDFDELYFSVGGGS